MAASSAAMKLSPAPTVSTTSTEGAGWTMRSPRKCASAPEPPRVITTSFGPIPAQRAAASEGGVPG